MITYKPIIRKSQKNIQGFVNIKIRVTKNRKATYLPTEHWILPQQFDMRNGKVKKNHPNYERINHKLNRQILKYQEELIDLGNGSYDYTIHTMRDRLTGKIKMNSDFYEILDDYVNQLKRVGRTRTAESYLTAKNSVRKFHKKPLLPFNEITINFLNKYELYLKEQGLSTNAIAVYLRTVRAVYNRAIDLEVAKLEFYPFRRFKIKKEEAEQRFLTHKEINSLINAELQGDLDYARDVFFLSFYLIGINMKDLYELSKIDEGHIQYRRSKTGKLFSIEIQKEAEELFNKYKGRNSFLVFAEDYANHRNFTKYTNKFLKKVAEHCKIDKPLSTYYARHSWATFAAELEIPKETISMALGHSKTSVTDIYIKFNRKKIDEANRKVIDYILNSTVLMKRLMSGETG